LVLDLFVIAPKPVNAFNIKHIVPFQPLKQLFILRPFKVLSGLFIHIDIFRGDFQLIHSIDLPILVLIPAADPDIAVNLPVQGSTSLLIEMILE